MVAVPNFITTSAAPAEAPGARQASAATSATAGTVAGRRVRIMVPLPRAVVGFIGPLPSASAGAADYSWLRNPAKRPFWHASPRRAADRNCAEIFEKFPFAAGTIRGWRRLGSWHQ